MILVDSQTQSRPPQTRRQSCAPCAPFVVLVLTLLAGLSGCGKSAEELATEHFDRARQHQRDGDSRAAVIELKNALQQKGDLVDARWMLGEIYLELGLGANAEKEFERALELGLKRDESPRVLTETALLQGKFALALERIEAAAPNSNDPTWLTLSGDAYLGLGDVERAKEAYQAALELAPDNNRARRGFAKVKIAKGDTDEAEREIARVLESSGDDLEALVLKGEMELRLQRFEEAEASFRRAGEIRENHASVMLGLTRALIAQSKSEEARNILDGLGEAAKKDPRSLFLYAIIAQQRNDLDAAMEALRDVLKVAPSHAPSLLLAGRIQYLKRQFEQAAEFLSRHLAINEGNIVARKLLGAVLIELKQPEDAIEVLEAGRAQASQDAQLLALLGTAYLNSGQPEKSQQLLDQAAERAPDAAAIRTQLALSHLATGDATEATSQLEAAIEIDPDFSRAEVLLILTHFQNREMDKALTVAGNLVEKHPDAPEAHNLLGAAHEANGELDQARASYEKSLEINANYFTSALNIARLDLIEGNLEPAVERYQSILEQVPDQPTAPPCAGPGGQRRGPHVGGVGAAGTLAGQKRRRVRATRNPIELLPASTQD